MTLLLYYPIQKETLGYQQKQLTFTFSLLKQQKGQFSSNDQSDTVVGSRSADKERKKLDKNDFRSE